MKNQEKKTPVKKKSGVFNKLAGGKKFSFKGKGGRLSFKKFAGALGKKALSLKKLGGFKKGPKLAPKKKVVVAPKKEEQKV
jgi:hypothetical protein